jgi:hypothetical protein
MLTMWFPRKNERSPEQGTEVSALESETQADETDYTESGLLKTMGWVSAALGAVALGLIVGRELRQRYKFNRRTPYDHYSHSGDAITDLPDVEFGVGI